jgi:hypothetical protein
MAPQEVRADRQSKFRNIGSFVDPTMAAARK